MMRRFSVALSIVVLCAGSLSAQMRRPTVYSNDPGVWITAGVAGFRANGVNDGATASAWDFGNSTNLQYRGSLEKGGSNGSSYGVAGSWAHVPFLYSSTGGAVIPPTGGGSGAQCPSCNAHLDMMTLVATFHSGSGIGLHQVLEFNGGVVAYRNLKRDSDGATLAPSGGDIDPLIGFGYGFGYGLSDRTNIDFLTGDAWAFHERKGLSNGTSNTNSMPSLRVSLRIGFGGQAPRR
jgi:hypothetical protein